MKILEVRDGFIKFEADKSIYLSSFIQVDGSEKGYIAQVNQIRNIGTAFLASAKILFLYINGELFNYDKTLPPVDAEIKIFTKDILNNSINAKKPVIIGKSLDDTTNINIDASAFDKKMLISIDTPEIHNLLIRNFSKQFENLGMSTVVIDTLGIINAKKYIAGKDFKLPLNTTSLNFMYESCLNDATAESKATIIDIFKELSEYSETVPFVPFETLKSIVEDMVDKQHIFKLLILKNKLAKFKKLGYFASKEEDVQTLNKILQTKCVVIDLSKLEPLFQNNYLAYLYEKLKNYKNVQVFLETANTVSKKNLKKIMTETDTPTAIITHSKFKYLSDIKNLFDNFIIEPCITNNEVFAVYSTFLTSMGKNTYLTAGEAINYIPLVSQAQIIDDVTPYSNDEIDKNDVSPQSEQEITNNNEQEEQDVQTETLGILDEEPENNDNDELSFEEITEVCEESEAEANDDTNPEFEEEIAKPEEIEDSEDYIELNSMTNEEALAAIDEKTDSVIASVTENLESPEEIDLFSETTENSIIDDSEEDTENDNIIQEELLEIDKTEQTEDEITLSNYDETITNTKDEEFELIDEDDSSDIAGSSQNVTIEPTEDSLTEEFNNIAATDTDDTVLLEESDLSELNEASEMIGSIEDDELVQQNVTENEDVLNELPPSEEEENTENFEVDFDNSIEFSEENLTETLTKENSKPEEADEVSSEETSEEDISVELSNDEDLLLDGLVEEEQGLTEEFPKSNIDVDLSEPQIIPIPGENSDNDLEELVELDAEESNDDDIIVDLSDENDTDKIDEEVEQQIMEDVDKVYTTMKNEDSVVEEISDSDLDLIDELNNDGEELEEYTGEELEEISDSEDGIINELHEETQARNNNNDSGEILEKKDSNTPIVPVYDADIPQEDMVMSDPIQQGDAVMHVKYGNGVVEKMIKYGTKTLFAINFENIGRRLLDPTLTEIKKV